MSAIPELEPPDPAVPDPRRLTLRAAYEKYHRSVSHAERYVEDVHGALKHWERCTTNSPIGDVTNDAMRGFKEKFLSTPLPSKNRLPKPTTFNKVLRTLDAIFSTLGPKQWGNPYGLGIISDVPKCRSAEEDEPDPVVASPEEVSRIYEHCEVATWPGVMTTGIRPVDLWQGLVVYLFNIGSRRSEFRRLLCTDVRFAERLVYTRATKTGKKRPFPLNETAARHLRKIWMPQPRELMFPFPRNDGGLYKQWRAIQRAAGIVVVRPEGSDRHDVYGFHELRKTCATELAGINEGAAVAICGHSSVATTRKHYIAKSGILRRTSEQLQQPQAFLATGTDPAPPAIPSEGPQLRLFTPG